LAAAFCYIEQFTSWKIGKFSAAKVLDILLRLRKEFGYPELEFLKNLWGLGTE
jgi:hypothetical protein